MVNRSSAFDTALAEIRRRMGTEKRPRQPKKPPQNRVATIYGLRAESEHQIRYVGSTINKDRRLATYKSDRPTHNPLLTVWLDSIGRDSLVMEVLEECREADRFRRERAWIETFEDDDPPLLNSGSSSQGTRAVRKFLAAMCRAPQYYLTPPKLRHIALGYIQIGRELRETHGAALQYTEPELLQKLNDALLPYERIPFSRPTAEELQSGLEFADIGGWSLYARPELWEIAR